MARRISISVVARSLTQDGCADTVFAQAAKKQSGPMKELSRRQLARAAGSASLLSLTPMRSWSAPARLAPGISKINGVQFGLQPYCYHDLPMNPFNRSILIQRMVENKLGLVELHMQWVQPNFSGESATPREAREKLREWRLTVPPDYYVQIRREFEKAGIQIGTAWVNFRDASDEEIDAIYKAAKQLGCSGVVGTYGIALARKLVPFAERYDIYTGLHNHDNLSDPDAFSNGASFDTGLSLSPKFMATLDVRHFTAGNGDCVDFLRKHYARTSAVHLGDRRRDNGRSTPFGEGDAPIIEVLQLIRDNGWPINCLLEFEHGTLRSGVDEVQIAYDYCKRALA